MIRVILAFLIAPIAPFLLYIITGPLLFFIVLFGIVYAYPIALGGGIPLFLLLRRYPHLQRARTYVIGAALLGFFGFTLSYLLIGSTFAEMYTMSILASLHGACSGYVFWRIVRPVVTTSAVKEVPSHA